MMTNLVQFPRLGLEFEIDRVAFSIGNIHIYWYGLIIAAGLLLALAFAFHYAPDFGVDADRLVDVVLVGTVCAIVCARAYYVAFAPFKYDSIWDMINLRDGGIAIYGAVIGAAVFGGLACKWRKVPVLPTFDLVAMGFLIGQGMGRWGNFFNQEAFGTNTNSIFGMYSRSTHEYLAQWQSTLAEQGVTVDPSMPVHPTFLYESVWCFVGFFALWAFMKKRRYNGQIALLYAVWYGAGRFWIEGLRTDSLLIPGVGLRVSQVVALVCVVAGLALLAVLGKKHKGVPFEVQLPVSGDALKQAKAAGLDRGQIDRIAGKLPAGASHRAFVDQTAQIAQVNWAARAAALADEAAPAGPAPAEAAEAAAFGEPETDAPAQPDKPAESGE